MHFYQSGSSYFLNIDTANRLKLVEAPQVLSSDFPDYIKLKNCAPEWYLAKLAEMATGLARFGSPETLRGRFLSHIWSVSSEEARRLLELTASKNLATHKCKVDAPTGTTFLFGRMTSSSIMQFYVPNTADLIYHNPIATD